MLLQDVSLSVTIPCCAETAKRIVDRIKDGTRCTDICLAKSIQYKNLQIRQKCVNL